MKLWRERYGHRFQTEHFTISEPHNPDIDKLYVDPKRRSTAGTVRNSGKARSGSKSVYLYFDDSQERTATGRKGQRFFNIEV